MSIILIEAKYLRIVLESKLDFKEHVKDLLKRIVQELALT